MKKTTTDTGVRRSLQIKNRWNPSRPFYVPALARAFRPDFSFSEQNSEDALKARRENKKKNNSIDDDSSSSSEGVTFESEIGQRRYQFCLKTIGQEVRRENPELVELVVTSLLRATECDVARTLHRAQQYFDFYVDVFGKLSFKQTLKDDWQLRKSFESGVLQVLENCDDKGRSAIILLFNRMLPGQTESSGMQIIQMINYIVLRTLKNYPTTQKHGFIVIPDMGGLFFENYSFSNARTNLYVISKFLPIKIHKFCLLRPLYFIKFVQPALKSFVFPGPMSANVHILSEDPRDLLREPINLRAEILPPMYGGTNTSYDFISRLRGWELEEEETEFSEMGSSCGNDGRVDDSSNNKTMGEDDDPLNDGRGRVGLKKNSDENERGRRLIDSIASERKQKKNKEKQGGLPPQIPTTTKTIITRRGEREREETTETTNKTNKTTTRECAMEESPPAPASMRMMMMNIDDEYGININTNHHNDNNNREEIGDDKESGFARELFKRQDQFGNDIAMDATRAPSRGSNDLDDDVNDDASDDDDFSNNADKTSNNSDMNMTSCDDNNTYDSADDKSFTKSFRSLR